MKRKKTLILLLFCLNFCLQTKKLSFDFKNNPLFGIGFVVWSDANSKYTLGGSISGFSSGSLILNLNGTDETFAPTSKYTFSQKLSSGTAYTVTLKANPTGYVCSVSNGTGKVGSSNIVNIDTVCSTASVSALYSSSGANWNDYVKNDGADIFSASGTACTGSETGTVTNGGVTYSGYRLCLHGGEMRKAEISSRSSCTGLTASDSLSALNWICRTDSAGKVFIYSTGLKQGKYLSDLIDWNTNGWKSIKLTVLDGSTTLMTTLESSSWWGNGFDASETLTPSTPGRIYIYKTSVILVNSGIAPSTDKTILIFRSAAANMMVGLRSTTCSGGSGVSVSRNFTWVEGRADLSPSTSNQSGISVSGNFNVLKNFRVQNSGTGCALTSDTYGFLFSGSSNNLLEDTAAVNTINVQSINYGKGYHFSAGSNGNTLINALSSNNTNFTSGGVGFSVMSSRNSIIGLLTINSNNGIEIGNGADDNSFVNLTSANNQTNGMLLSSASTVNRLFLQNIASVNNNNGINGTSAVLNSSIVENSLTFGVSGGGGVEFSIANLNSFYVTGNFKLLSTGSCSGNAIGGTNRGFVSGGCSTASPSDFAFSSVSSIGSSFSGTPNITPAVSDNGLNTSSGSAPADWLNFLNPWRTVGKYASNAFPNAAHRGYCSGTGCTVWDFSLKSADSVLRNTNACPSSFSGPTFIPGLPVQ